MNALPVTFAVIVTSVVAALPPVMAGYRRISPRRLAVLLYAITLCSLVLLPAPPQTCVPSQWWPLEGLANPVPLTQFACNIALFAPLGAMVRRGPPAALLLGALCSILIEFTQLTGVWFTQPCPYRVFDVNDVLANSAGALLGGLLAQGWRLLAARRSARHGESPQHYQSAQGKAGWKRAAFRSRHHRFRLRQLPRR